MGKRVQPISVGRKLVGKVAPRNGLTNQRTCAAEQVGKFAGGFVDGVAQIVEVLPGEGGEADPVGKRVVGFDCRTIGQVVAQLFPKRTNCIEWKVTIQVRNIGSGRAVRVTVEV